MNYDNATDNELAAEAARRMYGPALAHTPDGAPIYPPSLTGRIIRGLTLEFVHEFLLWAVGGCRQTVNYKQFTKTAQHLRFAQYDDTGLMLHPVPQGMMWHSVFTIGHVIVGGKIFEAVSIDRARAEIIAALRLSDGA